MAVTLKFEGREDELFPLFNAAANEGGQLSMNAIRHCYKLDSVKLNGMVEGDDRSGFTQRRFKDGEVVAVSGRPAGGASFCNGSMRLFCLLRPSARPFHPGFRLRLCKWSTAAGKGLKSLRWSVWRAHPPKPPCAACKDSSSSCLTRENCVHHHLHRATYNCLTSTES
jgi:hypothetical protein